MGSNTLWQTIVALGLLLIIKLAEAQTGKSLARGFNENINWVNIDDGLRFVKERKRPGLILIHKSWCGACKHLKPGVTQSKEMEDLSRKFVMINIQDEEEPNEKKYKPDGGYIPRVLFVNTEGEMMNEVINAEGSESYKYYYSSPQMIVKSMQRVLQKHSSDEL